MMVGWRVALLVSFLASLAAASPAHAHGWRDLFNGRDLAGWTQLGGDPERRGRFHVEDGVIVGTYVAGSANTFLATERPFGDFVLEFEFMIGEGINSGVQFRSALEGARVAGYQFEIDPSSRAWTGGVYHEAGRGWLYPLGYNPAARTAFRVNAWNTGRIECVGHSIRTWVNDRPAAHLIDDHAARGFIALQVHGIGAGSPQAGRTVRWRHVRIQDHAHDVAPPDDDLFIRNLIPNDLSAAERWQGWRLLFDGTSPDGWRGVGRDRFPSSGWRVEDGQLVIGSRADAPGPDRGDMITRDTFTSFDLQLEVMPTRGANSGIKYFVVEPERGAPAIGPEYQVLDDERHPDAKRGVAGNRTMASLYDLVASKQRVNDRTVPRRVDGWNHARIVAAPDGRVQHWLNGFVVVEYTRGSEAFDDLVERSKYQDHDDFGLAPAGHILLQDHGDEVRFRSIKVRRHPEDTAVSNLKPDERVLFLTTDARRAEDGRSWSVPIHAWVHELEETRARRTLFAAVLRTKYGLEITPENEANFRERVRLFVVDNEGGKRVTVRIGGETHTLPETGSNGHARTEITLDAATVDAVRRDGRLELTAILPDGDDRVFGGTVNLVEPDGISVISDIDDTVKITGVTDRAVMFDRTFLRDFEPAPGMAELYRRWAEQGATFHFVSSSPWHLYEPLGDFFDRGGFPARSVSLKLVRMKDKTIWDLFRKGTDTKPSQIVPILERFPNRRFVLVGDSGEQDPEVYALMMARFPERIVRIYIRNVDGSSPDDARYRRVFGSIDRDRWVLFDEPAGLELPD
ncbi:MAG: family 16 glycoside hydrolase [Planctomycetota bacterium]|jgi:hypothetical protein